MGTSPFALSTYRLRRVHQRGPEQARVKREAGRVQRVQNGVVVGAQPVRAADQHDVLECSLAPTVGDELEAVDEYVLGEGQFRVDAFQPEEIVEAWLDVSPLFAPAPAVHSQCRGSRAYEVLREVCNRATTRQ